MLGPRRNLQRIRIHIHMRRSLPRRMIKMPALFTCHNLSLKWNLRTRIVILSEA